MLAAENAGLRWEEVYPWEDRALRDAWQAELNLLQRALRAGTDAEAAVLVRQFIQQRTARRHAAGLSPTLVEYERSREWAEGLAKYAELAIWQAGHATPTYQPVPAVLADADFHAYAGFPRRWQNELSTLTNTVFSFGAVLDECLERDAGIVLGAFL